VLRTSFRSSSVIPCVCLALACLFGAAVGAAAQDEKTTADSNPTRPILFSVRPEFYRIADGTWRMQAIGRYDQATMRNRRWFGGKRGMLLRLEVPVVSADTPAVSRASGFGDAYAQILTVPRLSGRFAFVAGTGLVLPTATNSLLGTGQWILAPTAAPIWFLRGVGMALILVQDYVSVAGDDARPAVHFLAVTPTFVRSFAKRSWVLVDLESKTDWHRDTTVFKSGVQPGRIFSGVGLWVKPEVAFGPNRGGNWNLKTGIVWYR